VRSQPWVTDKPPLRRSFAFAELAPHLDAHDIDATVVVQTVVEEAETPELLALTAREPRVAGVVGWVDLAAPDCAERIATLRAAPEGDRLVGVRHTVVEEPDPRWLCRPDVRRGLAALGAAGLAYDLIVRADQLPAAIETVAVLPELRFVLDHAGGPDVGGDAFEPWREAMEALGGLPNAAVKLSGLLGEADVDRLVPYADALFAAFGPPRIMYGSDWPVCLLAADYDRVIGAAERLCGSLSPSESALVFGGTAVAWYGLA
jgi:L-fuconolactonase